LLFPSPASTYTADSFPNELIHIPATLNPNAAGIQDSVPALLFTSPSARFFMLYCHSNAEDLGRVFLFCQALRSHFQVHVLAVEYPGYGLCRGKADAESVTANTFVAFNFIRQTLQWPLEDILILGRSIGCGPALRLASRHKIGGLILICPFKSVKDLCADYIGHQLGSYVTERFHNLRAMEAVKSPVLLVHGRQDIIVPHTHSLCLYEVCRSRRKLIIPDNMGHNTNLLENATTFILPALLFFGLPDYNFDELTVPAWVYGKPGRLKDGTVASPRSSKVSSCDRQEAAESSKYGHSDEPARTSRSIFNGGESASLDKASAERSQLPSSHWWMGSADREAEVCRHGDSGRGRERQNGGQKPTQLPGREGQEGQKPRQPLDQHPLRAIAPDEATFRAMERFVCTSTPREAVFANRDDDAGPLGDELVVGWPAAVAAVQDEDLLTSDEEAAVAENHHDLLPDPPDDVGFFKAPRSRGVGPGSLHEPQELQSARPFGSRWTRCMINSKDSCIYI